MFNHGEYRELITGNHREKILRSILFELKFYSGDNECKQSHSLKFCCYALTLLLSVLPLNNKVTIRFRHLSSMHYYLNVFLVLRFVLKKS